MAKAKQFNITNFVDEAAESVRTAEQQKKKEQLSKARALLEAEKMAVNSQPTSTIQYMDETQQYMPQQEANKGKRGRKKSLRTIERINGKIVFLEKETDATLARISTLERFDKQDIIRTALHQWLTNHYDGMMLTGEGRGQVIEYIQRTTTFEEI